MCWPCCTRDRYCVWRPAVVYFFASGDQLSYSIDSGDQLSYTIASGDKLFYIVASVETSCLTVNCYSTSGDRLSYTVASGDICRISGDQLSYVLHLAVACHLLAMSQIWTAATAG